MRCEQAALGAHVGEQAVANAAGVDKSLVTINVTAASVRITATIAVPTSTTAAAVAAATGNEHDTVDRVLHQMATRFDDLAMAAEHEVDRQTELAALGGTHSEAVR